MGGFTLCGPTYTFTSIPPTKRSCRCPGYYSSIDAKVEDDLFNKPDMTLDMRMLPDTLATQLHKVHIDTLQYCITDNKERKGSKGW